MPSRTRTYFPPFSTTRRTYNSAGVLTSTTVTNHPVPHARYHPKEKKVTLDWGRTVNYKTKRQTQGYLPTLNLTANRLAIDGDWVWNVFRQPGTLARIELEYGHFAVPQSIDYVEVQNTTLTNAMVALLDDAKYECLSRARDMRVNLPVLFGEGRQTVRMLTETTKRLASAYRAFRKGRFKQAAKHLGINKPRKESANNWLAYQYGWAPLLSDAVGAATTLYDALEGNGKWGKRFSVRSGKKVGARTSTSKAFGGNYSVSGWNDVISYERQFVARAGLLLEVQNSVSAGAAALGVGLTDPLLTAWELTPFSFVFDWFVDIGGWLEARSSLQGLKVLTGYTTEERQYTGTSTMVYASGIYSKKDSPIPTWNWSTSRFIRKAWNGSIVTLRTPLYDGLNARRLTTLASLFIQRFSGDRRPGDPYPISPSHFRGAK